VKVEFTAADGVVSGLGQPVNVVGVKVGQVAGTHSTAAGGGDARDRQAQAPARVRERERGA